MAPGLFIVKFRINWTLCTGEVRKPRLPGDESVSLFLGFTIVFGFDFGFRLQMLTFFRNIASDKKHPSKNTRSYRGKNTHIHKVNMYN